VRVHLNALESALRHWMTAAHTVVIKGVKMFQGGAVKEYSDLEIMQMIGRAVGFQYLVIINLISHSRAGRNSVIPIVLVAIRR
jgi:hypothetical protein